MLLFAKLVTPVVVGAAFAGGAMFTLVHSQTQPPKENPAHQQILTYGD